MRNEVACVLAFLAPLVAMGSAVENELTIRQGSVEIDGVPREAMTINDQIPGPTLRWTTGDRVRIRVHNEMEDATSVHWHGILLPNSEDGVPGLTTAPIAPGASHVFEFPLRQAGTYWYHSHSGLQEQRGLYGAIVIEDPVDGARPAGPPPRDFVWMLSDWTHRNPKTVYRMLKRGSEQFAFEKGSVSSVWGAFRAGALGTLPRNSIARMPPMDVSDVAYDAFLSNGKREASLRGTPGERVRIRAINASAATYFYLDSALAPLRVIAADGLPVETVEIDRILIAVAETYDFEVVIPKTGSFELRATSQDGSGTTSLWIGEGDRSQATGPPAPSVYSHKDGAHPGRGEDTHEIDPHPLASHDTHSVHAREGDARPLPPYSRLRAPSPSAFSPEAPRRAIHLRLTGDMERYVWSFDGKVLSEADLIPVHRGEVLRVTLENTTMMHHPLHLHGHFFRVLNGAGDRSPRKHTVDVPPLGTTIIEFFGSEDRDWFFHCHILYHMKSGMARIFRYEGSRPNSDLDEAREALFREAWLPFVDASIFSHFSEGELRAETSRHSLHAEWELGWQRVPGVDHEVHSLYRFHANRLYRLLAGGSFDDERNAGVFGVEAVLPLNLQSQAWVDTRGEGRFSLDKELRLTPRFSASGELEYDTAQRWEGSAGLSLRAREHLDLGFRWHSEYGFGGGLELRF